jgi:rhomboid protease GluP
MRASRASWMVTPPDTETTPVPAEPLRPAPVPVRISLLDLLGIEPPKHLWVSSTILWLNAIVFGVMVASGASVIQPSVDDILRFGANHGPALAAGEWWRLLSCAFVHVGVFHIVFNMWALRSLSVVEAVYGNGAFALIYLASALGGSVASALAAVQCAWK